MSDDNSDKDRGEKRGVLTTGRARKLGKVEDAEEDDDEEED